jgi:hypothetical protein
VSELGVNVKYPFEKSETLRVPYVPERVVPAEEVLPPSYVTVFIAKPAPLWSFEVTPAPRVLIVRGLAPLIVSV